jgi:putative metalloprotease
MRGSCAVLLAVVSFASGCSDILRSPMSFGSGSAGTINPSQILSVGEDLYKAATLSDDDVKKIARESIAEMDRLNPVAGPNDPYAKRLNKLVAGLQKEDGLDLNFKVYLVRDVNAFSMPDGSIRVFSSLMDRMSDDELRFILGHEIGHIKHGHRKSRLQRAYAANAAVNAANAGLKATSSGLGGAAAVLGGDIAAKLASEVLKGQFSQSDETESDEYGLHVLAKHSHPKEASITALKKLGEVSGEGESSSDLFTSLTSSHPDPLARAQHMQSLIPELAGQPDLASQPIQVASNSPQQPDATNAVAAQKDGASSPEALLPSDLEAAPAHEQPSVPSTTTQVAALQAKPHNGLQHNGLQHNGSRHSNAPQQGWYIQVGAFANKDSAVRVKQSLANSAAAISAFEPIASRKTLYRVVVGPFDSRNLAEEQLGAIRAPHGSSSGAFVRHLPAGS